MSMPLPAPSPESVAQGVRAITAVDDRWLHCDIKSISLLANVLLRQRSVDQGCAETILLRDGYLTEGSASNIFVVRAGQILAPPKSSLILPGVTYDVVIELTGRLGLDLRLGPVSDAELRAADEVWLTSSTKEVTAVTTLDDRPVGEGVPGPVFRLVWAAYQDFKHRVMRGHG
jgi:D-alanine transaminase